MEKVNVHEKLEMISSYWDPKIAGELNGQHVKLVKFKGEFVWHKHENEDEMFYVIKGSFTMKHRDGEKKINENEFIIIPKGVEHCPYAEEEVWVMLFEPAGTLNTGNIVSNFTKSDPARI
ncbi:MAG TPA: cupin domain-containing protein [Ignavibacteria bacterium]|nr:cupin domain-containing protein [Ignavibacteria bacterium]